MPHSLLIYGATGFTGRRTVEALLRRGLRPILAGRDPGRVGAMASALDLEGRSSPLTDPDAIDRMLRGVSVVLHLAGPFLRTCLPMLEACLRARSHYLDVSGEVAAIEAVAARRRVARERRVMLMPSVGFDVVPSDCLAVHLVGRLPRARRLWLAIAGLDAMTPGSARAFLGHAGRGRSCRRAGVLVDSAPGGTEREFPFGDAATPAVGVSLADVVTAYHSTGIPDIEGFFAATPALRATVNLWRSWGPFLATGPAQAFLGAWAEILSRGPEPETRPVARTVIVAEAEDDRGGRAVARLRCPEAYSFTAETAACIASRVLGGDLEPGFETPGRLFGPGFALSFPGVQREDLE